MNTKLPNFLIVGAMKSGTTSLYYYLKQHPEIYMSPVKEPNFLSDQLIKFPITRIGRKEIKHKAMTLEEYKNLFENVKSEKAIGEASPDSLYFYADAIKNIKKYLGDIKIIIILRNPIERAFSNYLHQMRECNEFLSFEKALEAEKERLNDWWAWGYQSIGFYYTQVKAYMDNFSQVKVYLYDDLKKDTLVLVKELYQFLGVDSSFVPDIKTKYNVSGVPKNKLLYRLLHNLLTKPNILKTIAKLIVKPFLPRNKRKELAEKLKAKNLVKIQMNPATREYLKNLYHEDILKLQNLINRDLSCWLT